VNEAAPRLGPTVRPSDGTTEFAPVAQLDRASASGAEGPAFESRLAHRVTTQTSSWGGPAHCSQPLTQHLPVLSYSVLHHLGPVTHVSQMPIHARRRMAAIQNGPQRS
jgi:hypothetical protein